MFPQIGFGEPSVFGARLMTESVSRDDLGRPKRREAKGKLSKTYAGKGRICLPYQIFRTAPFQPRLTE
jgi:hypothetical protein